MQQGYLNTPIDAIIEILKTSENDISGIRIPLGKDRLVSIKKFMEYLQRKETQSYFTTAFSKPMSICGPVDDKNFELGMGDIFYIGIGDTLSRLVKEKMANTHIGSKKVMCVQDNVLRQYPVFILCKQYACVKDIFVTTE